MLGASPIFEVFDPDAVISGFTVTNGMAVPANGPVGYCGGGIYCKFSTIVITNCVLIGNFATHYGGGAYGGTVVNCIVMNNTGTRSGGGLNSSYARNCLIAFNTGGEGPNGGGGGISGGTVESCTIVSNKAWRITEGFLYGGGVLNTVVTNSIVYFNKGVNAGVDNWSGGSQDYSCTLPLPGSGTNNIDGDPMFKDLAGLDFHPINGSPSINGGTNLQWMDGFLDLEGNPRVLSGRVDLGAYEQRLSPGTVMVLR